jgi:hypothetical protein|uniref:Uncharacterized protein n=1 Tax=viral metagenome TaxID=1070528 RepID=A0A6C0LNV0_9ZZZZ
MENSEIARKIPTLSERMKNGLLLILSFSFVFYMYGKYDLSFAEYLKNAFSKAEEYVKTTFYKLWLNMKMRGNAIKVNYNDYDNIFDNSLDIDFETA